MTSTSTPSRGAIAVPGPIPVTDNPRGRRTRIIKRPYDPDDVSTSISTDVSSPKAIRGPPKPSRAIVNLQNVQDVISETAVCRKCRRKALMFEVITIGIASAPKIHCLNCKKEAKGSLASAELYQKTNRHKALSDYAANVLFVLGFLTVGDGGREAERLLGMLDMPNLTTMEKASFSKIEQKIAPLVIQLAEEAMLGNLIEEVSLSEDNPDGFNLQEWQDSVTSGNPHHLSASFPSLRVSTDMGWQHRRPSMDSLTGHCFFFGAVTRKPTWWCLKGKYCKVCSKYSEESEIPEHDYCPRNHSGSSKSMEPLAVVDMVHEMYDKFHCKIKYLIMDDDSTMKANCRWNNVDFKNHFGYLPRVGAKQGIRKNTGLLRYPIPQPQFLGDPNHRAKCASKAMRSLENKKVKQTAGCLEIDRLRASKNFAYFIRQLHSLPQSEWTKLSRAVVDHHFDIHGNCGAFCSRKDESSEERAKTNKFYRCVEENKELYDAIWDIMGDFLTLDRLQDVAHDYDTNCNESMNNIIAHMAPKNKCYAGSISLKSRVAIAVSIQTLGFEKFFLTLLGRMKVEVTPGTAYFLHQYSKGRDSRTERSKLPEKKLQRKRVYHDKLKRKTEEARADMAAGRGYYKGIALKAEAIEGEEDPPSKKAKTSNSARPRKPCKCGSLTHQRTNSLQCPRNRLYVESGPEKNRQYRADMEEQSAMDTLGLAHCVIAKALLDKEEG